MITAVFLLLLFAALGAFMVSMSSTQHASSATDVQGSRAYWAARTGIEWGAYQALQPAPSCVATNNLSGPAGLGITVQCTSSTYTEGANPDGAPRTVTVYQLTATACSPPTAAGSCPNPDAATVGSLGYVERQVWALVSQ